MATMSRVEKKSRPHKRKQGETGQTGWVKGRQPRFSSKTAPKDGYGPEVKGTATAPVSTWTHSATGLLVNFTGPTDVAGNTYKWTFGDGSTSTLRLPTHTYDEAGTYNVKRAVKNSNTDLGSSTTAPVTVTAT